MKSSNNRFLRIGIIYEYLLSIATDGDQTDVHVLASLNFCNSWLYKHRKDMAFQVSTVVALNKSDYK